MADSGSPLRRFLETPSDHPVKTLVVALVVALICSTLVTAAAVLLKPLQVANKEAERQRHIADLMGGVPAPGERSPRGGTVVDNRFADLVQQVPGLGDRLARGEATLEARIVDLASGGYVTGEPSLFDQRRAARDADASVAVPSGDDIAWIKRRAKQAVVYLLMDKGKPLFVLLPVHGKGYGSTLYGYLGLTADLGSVIGLTIYEHGETPGLGALVDAPAWRRQWFGKKIWDLDGAMRIGVAEGPVDPASPGAAYQVDGLSGATVTGQGVTNMLRFWLGKNGFGPYLKKLGKG